MSTSGCGRLAPPPSPRPASTSSTRPREARGWTVGCGPGDTTVALAERLAPGRARGVDFAPAMVERAQARFGGREGVSFDLDDAERLSLPDASVDVVSCSFSLMYCYDARSALRGASRVLRPGGRMLQVVGPREGGLVRPGHRADRDPG